MKAETLMGASMAGFLEWTHDALTTVRRPELWPPLGPPRWEDDYLHGMSFDTDKEYDFFAVISGARSRFNKPPLIKARGVPKNLSLPASRYLEGSGGDLAGWLHLSEIDRCIAHITQGLAGPFYTGLEIEIALE